MPLTTTDLQQIVEAIASVVKQQVRVALDEFGRKPMKRKSQSKVVADDDPEYPDPWGPKKPKFDKGGKKLAETSMQPTKLQYARTGERPSQVLSRYQRVYGAHLTVEQLADAAARDACIGAACQQLQLDYSAEYQSALNALGGQAMVQKYSRQRQATGNRPSVQESVNAYKKAKK